MTYTDKEKESIQELRLKLHDLELDEEGTCNENLIRWLIARNFDIKEAEQLFRKSLKWREENGISRILEWEPPIVFRQNSPEDICGYAHNGMPVVIIPLRFFNMDQFLEFDETEYMRFCMWNIERYSRACKANKRCGIRNYQVMFIYDIEGMDFARVILNPHYLGVFRRATTMIESNYPEVLYKGFVVFAPTIFSVIFSMGKAFLPTKTVEKVEFLGFDIDTIRKRLTEFIPVDILPTRYGGTNSEFEKMAYDKCVFQQHNTRHIRGVAGKTEILVPAGEKQDCDYVIEKAPTTIKWEFTSDGYDIGFGVIRPHDAESVVTAACQRVNAHETKQCGSIICHEIGKYSLVFDNTYSKFRSKSVELKVDIFVPPQTMPIHSDKNL